MTEGGTGLEPDEGVLLLMIAMPLASLCYSATVWSEEERLREAAEDGRVWDVEAQRERDRAEERAIKSRAQRPRSRMAAAVLTASGEAPEWLRWMPRWAYKKLASCIGHHELEPLRDQLQERSDQMMSMHRKLRWRTAGLDASRQVAKRTSQEHSKALRDAGRAHRRRALESANALAEENLSLEAGQRAREEAIHAEQEARLDSARHRAHEQLMASEAAWQREHLGTVGMVEKQAHVQSLLIKEELSDLEVDRYGLSQMLERQNREVTALRQEVDEKSSALHAAAAWEAAARDAEEARAHDAALAAEAEEQRRQEEEEWATERLLLEGWHAEASERLESARGKQAEHEREMEERTAELEEARRQLEYARAHGGVTEEDEAAAQEAEAARLAVEEEAELEKLRAEVEQAKRMRDDPQLAKRLERERLEAEKRQLEEELQAARRGRAGGGGGDAIEAAEREEEERQRRATELQRAEEEEGGRAREAEALGRAQAEEEERARQSEALGRALDEEEAREAADATLEQALAEEEARLAEEDALERALEEEEAREAAEREVEEARAREAAKVRAATKADERVRDAKSERERAEAEAEAARARAEAEAAHRATEEAEDNVDLSKEAAGEELPPEREAKRELKRQHTEKVVREQADADEKAGADEKAQAAREADEKGKAEADEKARLDAEALRKHEEQARLAEEKAAREAAADEKDEAAADAWEAMAAALGEQGVAYAVDEREGKVAAYLKWARRERAAGEAVDGKEMLHSWKALQCRRYLEVEGELCVAGSTGATAHIATLSKALTGLRAGGASLAEEVCAWDAAELAYVLDGTAGALELEGRPKHFADSKPPLARDAGHDGMSFDDFCRAPQAKAAGLGRSEVLALRLCTGRLGIVLDEAMRTGAEQLGKWATTLALLVSALDKLAAATAASDGAPTVLYGVVEESARPLGGDKGSSLFAQSEKQHHRVMVRGLTSLCAEPKAARELLGADPAKRRRALLMVHASGHTARKKDAAYGPMAVANVRWVSQFPQQEEYLLSPCHVLHLQRQPERRVGEEGKPLFEKPPKLGELVELPLGGGGSGGVARGFQAELQPHEPFKLKKEVDELTTPYTVPGSGAALDFLSTKFATVFPNGAAAALRDEDTLELPHTALNDEQAEYVGLLAGRGARAVAPKLNALVLRGCHLTGSGLKRLAAALACDRPGSVPQLTSVDVHGTLQRALESGGVLERSSGGAALGMIVASTPSLTALSAGGHPLKAAGVKALAAAVGEHAKLRDLDLQDAALDSGAALELGSAIKASAHLRAVDVRHNGLSKELKDTLGAAASKTNAARKQRAKEGGGSAETLTIDLEPQGGGGGDSGDGGGKKGAAAARTKSSVRRDVQKGGKANLGKPKNPRANKK